MALPVTIVASGGLPVIDMAANGFPVTSVASGGLPVTLVVGYNLGIGVTFVSESGVTLTAPILTWVIDTADLTPAFTFDFVDPAVSDVVTLRRSTDAGFATYTDATETITDIAPPTLSGSFDFGGDWTATTWYVKCFVTRGAAVSTDSNTETFTLVSASSNFLLEGGANQILMEGGTSLLITEGS